MKLPKLKKPFVDKQPSKHGWGKGLSLGFAIIGAGAIAWFGSQLLGSLLAPRLLAPFDGLSELGATFVTYLIIQAILILFIISLSNLFRANIEQLGLGGVKNWTYPLLLPLIYLGSLMISGLLTALAAYLFSSFDMNQVQNLGLPDVMGSGDLIIMGLLLVVAVPLAEEFLFRGYLFGLLRRALPFWLVALVTSGLFALAHGQWNVAIDTFVLGMVLAYLREKTGSIWTGVALHALKNFIAFLLLFVYNIV